MPCPLRKSRPVSANTVGLGINTLSPQRVDKVDRATTHNPYASKIYIDRLPTSCSSCIKVLTESPFRPDQKGAEGDKGRGQDGSTDHFCLSDLTDAINNGSGAISSHGMACRLMREAAIPLRQVAVGHRCVKP